jgi:glucokinase
MQVRITHDVRAALRAEMETGKLAGCRQGILLSIGTGIGAAVIVDGRMADAEGYAGEIGHMDIGSEIKCACGAKGCLETVASGRSISINYGRRSGNFTAEASEIAILAHQGDPIASEVWTRAIDGLAVAIRAVCSLMGTERITIAGGVSMARNYLIHPLTTAVTKSLTFQRTPEIVISDFGDLATLQGALIEGLFYARYSPE